MRIAFQRSFSLCPSNPLQSPYCALLETAVRDLQLSFDLRNRRYGARTDHAERLYRAHPNVQVRVFYEGDQIRNRLSYL